MNLKNLIEEPSLPDQIMTYVLLGCFLFVGVMISTLDEIFYTLKNSAYIILFGNIVVLISLIISLLIEKLTILKLFWDNLKWAKSPRNAIDSATRDTGIYFIINLVVFIYEMNEQNISWSYMLIITWFIIVFLISKMFYRLHLKYQSIDPNKADDDYS